MKNNKVIKKHPILAKVVSIIFVVAILFVYIAFPVSAFMVVTPSDTRVASFKVHNPINSIWSFAKPYDSGNVITEDYEKGVFWFTPTNEVIAPESTFNYLAEQKQLGSDPDEIGLLHSSIGNQIYYRNFVDNYHYYNTGSHSIFLQFKKSSLGYSLPDIDLSNPTLLVINKFTVNEDSSEKYTTITSSNANSFIVNFDNYVIQTQGATRPSIIVPSANLPPNTTCETRIVYDKIIHSTNPDGSVSLSSEHVDRTYSQSSWRSRICYLFPLNISSEHVLYENYTCYITIRNSSGDVIVPHDIELRNLASPIVDRSILDYIGDIDSITKYKPITSITSWLGETVAAFFDIEIFPNFRLSAIIGIIVALSVTVWVLKLMAGG